MARGGRITAKSYQRIIAAEKALYDEIRSNKPTHVTLPDPRVAAREDEGHGPTDQQIQREFLYGRET